MNEGNAALDVSRRQLLRGLGIGGLAIVALPLGARAAAASVATTTIWRLNAEWGYPAGPKGRTRCTCSTCHSHAANKLFRTEAAAIAGRLHTCCVCQPEAITTSVAGATSLFAFARPADPNSIDLRWPGVRGAFAALDVPDDPGPGPDGSSGGSNDEVEDVTSAEPNALGAASAAPGLRSGTLPVTGTDLRVTTAWGAFLAAAGGALWFRSRNPDGRNLESER